MYASVAGAIVTFGHDSETGHKLVTLLRENGLGKVDVFDLRRELRDPKQVESRVKHQMDGTHEWTQRAAYSQSNFPEVMQKCVSQIEKLAVGNRGVIVCSGLQDGIPPCGYGGADGARDAEQAGARRARRYDGAHV